MSDDGPALIASIGLSGEEAQALITFVDNRNRLPDDADGLDALARVLQRLRSALRSPEFRVYSRSDDGKTVDVGTGAEWERRWRELFAAALNGLCARSSPLDNRPPEAEIAQWTKFNAEAIASEAHEIANAALRREMSRAASRNA